MYNRTLSLEPGLGPVVRQEKKKKEELPQNEVSDADFFAAYMCFAQWGVGFLTSGWEFANEAARYDLLFFSGQWTKWDSDGVAGMNRYGERPFRIWAIADQQDESYGSKPWFACRKLKSPSGFALII